MDQHNYNKQHTLNDLVSEYEAMSQKGTVGFFEETVFSQIITYYESESAIDLALDAVNHALKQHFYSAPLYCKKAELLAIQKREAAALNALEKAEVLSPLDYEVKLIKAEVLGLFGNYVSALSIIGTLKGSYTPERSKELSDVFFSEGIIYERMKEYDAMFDSFKQSLNYNPANEEALDRIWSGIEMSRKFEDSLVLCNKVIDHDPYSYKAWFYLGHTYTYFGKYREAIEAYEYSFIINKNFEWAYRHCAELSMEIKDYKKALDCYEEALLHISPDGELLFKIGQCYHFSKKTQIAKEFYKRSIKLDDLNDETYYYLGKCADEMGDWKTAIQLYKQAIEIDENREEYYAALAELYAQLNEHEKAFHYFDRAIELAPQDAIYWVKFAAFLMRSTAYNEALEVLLDAEEDAVGPELLYCKVACLFKMNNQKEAMDVLAEALTEDFEMHTTLFDYLPELESDRKISAIIAFYKYEE